MTDVHVEALRRFNRSYTRRIGVLDESYLGTGRPLGPSRLLWEIGRAGTPGVRVGELRRRLGLDSGYLSRLLRRLEADGLVDVGPDPADGRQRVARATATGRREHDRLERRSAGAAAGLLAWLTERQQAALATALDTAQRLLDAAAVDVVTVDPASSEARAALARYYAELDRRFRHGFDPGDPGAGHHEDGMRPPAGLFVVLRADGDVVGCGAVQRVDARTAEIKRMWIDDAWRGVGLGGRLLSHLEGAARAQRRRRVILDTNEVLTEAVAMYERAGYHRIERYNDNPYAHHWFAKDLRG